MLHAELGRRPVEINIKTEWLAFGYHLKKGKYTKLSMVSYNKILHDYKAEIYEHKWIRCIRGIIVSIGRLDLFHKSVIDNPRSVKMSVSRVLFDWHIQEWVQKFDASSKAKFYFSFKQDLTFQNYVSKLDSKHYLLIIKFRTSNHNLPVETGRWEDVPLDERMCQLCTKTDIGGEFHYLLCCKYFDSERKRLMKPYFYTRPNMLNFKDLLCSDDLAILKKLRILSKW